MSKFSPTPRQIFDVVSQVTGIAPEELRSESADEKVKRAQDWTFFFSRIWTSATDEKIGEATGIAASKERIVAGISEATKILYSNVDYVREALQFSRSASDDFVYNRLRMDDKTPDKVCQAFMDANMGYRPVRHGPYAETLLLFGRGLIRVDDNRLEPLITIKRNAVNIAARWAEMREP